jgi:hypothetical protein
MKTLSRLLLLLVLILIAIAPLFAGWNSASAFGKIQSLAGDWEGKDDKGKPVKTTFKSIVSGTAVTRRASAVGCSLGRSARGRFHLHGRSRQRVWKLKPSFAFDS